MRGNGEWEGGANKRMGRIHETDLIGGMDKRGEAL